MKTALEILDIPTWHFMEMARNTPEMPVWSEAMRAKFEPERGLQPFGRAEFDDLLGQWGACTDQPACLFAEELIEAYPEAKIVLVQRDVNRWYQSYLDTAIQGSKNPLTPLAAMIDPVFIGQCAVHTDLQLKYFFGVKSATGVTSLTGRAPLFEAWRQNAKAAYLAHNERVKRAAPPDRLLLFNLADGWEPLCAFLGKPVPDVPFPRVNETAAMQEQIKRYIVDSYRKAAVRAARWLLPLAAVMIAGIIYWAR